MRAPSRCRAELRQAQASATTMDRRAEPSSESFVAIACSFHIAAASHNDVIDFVNTLSADDHARHLSQLEPLDDIIGPNLKAAGAKRIRVLRVQLELGSMATRPIEVHDTQLVSVAAQDVRMSLPIPTQMRWLVDTDIPVEAAADPFPLLIQCLNTSRAARRIGEQDRVEILGSCRLVEKFMQLHKWARTQKINDNRLHGSRVNGAPWLLRMLP